MPRDSGGIYTRVDNSFSDPILGEIISPTDATSFWDDLTAALNDLPAELGTYTGSGTGAVERTVQGKLGDFVNARDFGVTGNGTTDDRDNLQHALDSGTGTVFLPANSVVRLTSGITIPDAVQLIGLGNSTILANFATGDVITMGLTTVVQNLQIASDVTRTTGAHIRMPNNARISDVTLQGYYQGINAASVAARALTATIENVIMFFPSSAGSSGGYAMRIHNYAGSQIHNVVAGGPVSSPPEFGFVIGSGDTLICDMVHMVGHGQGLELNPPGTVEFAAAIFLSNCLFDSADGTGVPSGRIRGASNTVNNVIIVNTTFSNTIGPSSHGLVIDTTGTGAFVSGVALTNVAFDNNTGDGLHVSNTSGNTLAAVSVVNGHAGGNDGSGYYFSAATRFGVSNVEAGPVAGQTGNNIGITVTGACNDYDITDNILRGNSSALDQSGVTGTPRRNVWGNINDSSGPYGPSIFDLSPTTADHLYGTDTSSLSNIITISSPLSLSGSILSVAGGGAALTRTNDTNVTATLGGSPNTALLAATSITLGWTGTLAAGRGGFGADVSASSGVPLFAAGVPTFTSTTGTGNFVRATSPTLVTPALGTPSAIVLTSATGLPISTGVSGLGTGIATALAVNVGSAGAPVVFNGVLGTPSSGTATNLTGLPIAGITGLGTGVGTWLATPSSANLATAITDETGSGALVFATSPSLITPTLGAASATSINKVTLTAPATSATITLTDGTTLTQTTSTSIGRGQYQGTNTNDSATAGNIGETVTNTATGVALTTATNANVTSISLTAGDWIVHGAFGVDLASTTTLALSAAGISTTTATFPLNFYISQSTQTGTGPLYVGSVVPTQHLSLSGTTTVFLVAKVFFGTSTATAEGSLVAHRIR